MSDSLLSEQLKICEKFNSRFVKSEAGSIIGYGKNMRSDFLPINGMRHLPEGNANGWYIWSGGEPGGADDFFDPLHLSHLSFQKNPWFRFLGLEPGWRFLWTPDYEDVWFDKNLLTVN